MANLVIDIPEDYAWLDPWAPITDDDARIDAALTNELASEVCSIHPLSGVAVRPIAFDRSDTDHVLFLTDRAAIPIVCVKLTWRKQRFPDRPHFDIYESLDAWTVQMGREHGAMQQGDIA